MKIIHYLVFILFLILFSQCKTPNSAVEQNGWERLPEIMSRIKAPEFPDKVFNVIDFGAKPDGEADNEQAFRDAIEQCNIEGGGKVTVPAGKYICNGPIVLLSNVNFHLEEGAVIKFSTNPEDYLPAVFTRWEGVECYNYSPLIYAYKKENIAVTGSGIFDGQASEENWWIWKGRPDTGWQEGFPTQSEENSKPRLMEMNLKEVPVQERQFGSGTYLRPNFIQPYECKNVLIEGVTFLDSPMWFIHPVLCENVTVKNVTTTGKGPNNDGCNPESSKDVLITGCEFDNGDDCIAIKSGRNNDGRRIGVPSENIIVKDCKMKDGHGGVVMGSEISGGVKNVFVEDCEMDSPELDRAIRLKSNTYRGGTIENIYVRNVKVGEVGGAIVRMNMKYAPREGDDGGFIPVMQNVLIENVTSKKSKYAFRFEGLDNSKIKNIIIRDCKFDGVENESILQNVENLELENVYINGVKQ